MLDFKIWHMHEVAERVFGRMSQLSLTSELDFGES